MGFKGEVGDYGDYGDYGAQESAGDEGPQGLKGPQGPKGVTGVLGPEGDYGPDGKSPECSERECLQRRLNNCTDRGRTDGWALWSCAKGKIINFIKKTGENLVIICCDIFWLINITEV